MPLCGPPFEILEDPLCPSDLTFGENSKSSLGLWQRYRTHPASLHGKTAAYESAFHVMD